MLVRFLTTSCGPEASKNWSEGEKRNVSLEEAKTLEQLRVIELLEPYPFNVEKAVIGAPEKAVVNVPEKAVTGAPETAGNGNGKVDEKKPAVESPASPDKEKQDAKPAGWGKQ